MEPTKPSSAEQEGAPRAAQETAPPPSGEAAPMTPSAETPPKPDAPPQADPTTTAQAPPVGDAAQAPPPVAPKLSDEERLQLQKSLQDTRSHLLAVLLANQRPKPEAFAAAAETYLQAGRAAPGLAAEEWQQLRAALLEKWTAHNLADAGPYGKSAVQTQQYVAAYDALFENLPKLDKILTDEVGRLSEDHELFQKAPPELRDILLNYKKGLEIIQRMAKRVQERKKPLPAFPPLGDPPALPETAPDAAPLAELIIQLCAKHHDWRTARANVLREAQKTADTCTKETLTSAKNLLGALDGVEGGLRSEPEILERVKDQRAEHAALIDLWFGAYQRIELGLAPFYNATGLQPHIVEPGVPFHPDTMEPGGTVSDPARKNEDVASVLRRGYALLGEFIRPILVEVVVNAPSEPKG